MTLPSVLALDRGRGDKPHAYVLALVACITIGACDAAPPVETCTARVVVSTPSPSPLAIEGDVARVVIAKQDVTLLDDVVDLFGAGQAGGSVDVLSPSSATAVLAGTDLALVLIVFSSITNEVVAVGRARFDCAEAGAVVDVPLYLGPANGLAAAPAPPSARAGATLTTLPPKRSQEGESEAGRVLLFGGGGAPAIFDASSNTWCTAADEGCLVVDSGTALTRIEHTATTLADGRILIVGGFDVDAGAVAADVLLVDPASAASSSTGVVRITSIATLERRGAGAAAIDDDTVLVVGGYDGGGAPSADAFLVGADGTVRPTIGSLVTARAFAAAAPLPGGGALVAGGETSEDDGGAGGGGANLLDSIEIFRSDETFGAPLFACPSAPEGENLCARRSRAQAIALDDGNVLIAGGIARAFALSEDPPPDGDVFVLSDQRALPATQSSSITGTDRAGATLARIDCGAPPCPVLIVGGLDAAHALFFVAATPPPLGAPDYGGTIVEASRDVVRAAFAGVAAAPLRDGTVIVVGGGNAANVPQQSTSRFTFCEADGREVCPSP